MLIVYIIVHVLIIAKCTALPFAEFSATAMIVEPWDLQFISLSELKPRKYSIIFLEDFYFWLELSSYLFVATVMLVVIKKIMLMWSEQYPAHDQAGVIL